jgi:hypothetical protein
MSTDAAGRQTFGRPQAAGQSYERVPGQMGGPVGSPAPHGVNQADVDAAAREGFAGVSGRPLTTQQAESEDQPEEVLDSTKVPVSDAQVMHAIDNHSRNMTVSPDPIVRKAGQSIRNQFGLG